MNSISSCCIADLFIKYGGKDSDIPKSTHCIVLPSNRGGFNVQDENLYVYNRDHENADGSCNWVCQKRQKFKCRAVIKIAEGLIIWQRREHNHLHDDK